MAQPDMTKSLFPHLTSTWKQAFLLFSIAVLFLFHGNSADDFLASGSNRNQCGTFFLGGNFSFLIYGCNFFIGRFVNNFVAAVFGRYGDF